MAMFAARRGHSHQKMMSRSSLAILSSIIDKARAKKNRFIQVTVKTLNAICFDTSQLIDCFRSWFAFAIPRNVHFSVAVFT